MYVLTYPLFEDNILKGTLIIENTSSTRHNNGDRVLYQYLDTRQQEIRSLGLNTDASNLETRLLLVVLVKDFPNVGIHSPMVIKISGQSRALLVEHTGGEV